MIFFIDKKNYAYIVDYIIHNEKKTPLLKITDNNSISIKAKATYIFYIKNSSA